MRSKNTSDNKHLLSILIVIGLSLAAWAVEESRSTFSPNAIQDLLYVLAESNREPLKQGDDLDIDESDYRVQRFPDVIVSKNYRDVFAMSLKPQPISDYSICLNSIDSASLESLPVFGPKLAGRTIKYRDLLGGFISPVQLIDVYGFDEGKLLKVNKWFKCDTALIEKICVDTASWQTLRKHPYIGKSGATVITRYAKHNSLDQTSQLRNLPQMNDSTWGRWRPYIEICN